MSDSVTGCECFRVALIVREEHGPNGDLFDGEFGNPFFQRVPHDDETVCS